LLDSGLVGSLKEYSRLRGDLIPKFSVCHATSSPRAHFSK
jgi:hypothetical protein